MDINFKEKNILITGAARGIGKIIAQIFAENGATVIIADIDSDSGLQTENEMRSSGYSCEFFQIDLSNTNQINTMISSLFLKYGHIEILVNNARAGERTLLSEESDENWDLTIDVSLKAPLFLSKAFIKSIQKSDNDCSIINISSVSSTAICNESASYHIAKAGLENLTRYLSVSGGEKGVRVNAIRPGFIVQDEHFDYFMSSKNADYREMAEFCHPIQHIGRSEDVANATLFLSSGLATFITGQILTVDGGLSIQDQWAIVSNFNKFRNR
ncbi:MAG: SDR family oxidoreductase [Candidatus Marinimicrobia bacterium]|nr:SDR family oxidoreductase [Candidatus Neomarinimicrobiota bacterium]